MLIGLDTGFFVRLLQKDKTALKVWEDLSAAEIDGVVCCLTLYELHGLGLRGKIAQSTAAELVASIPEVCRVVWLSAVPMMIHAAELSHRYGVPAIDSMIAASVKVSGAVRLYTTDRTLLPLHRSGFKIVVLAGQT